MRTTDNFRIPFFPLIIIIFLTAGSAARGENPCVPMSAPCIDDAPTLAAEIDFPAEWERELTWDPSNPTEIERSGHADIQVIGGAPPYDYSVQEQDYYLDASRTVASFLTEESKATVYAGAGCTSNVTVTVTDARGDVVSGELALAQTTLVYLEFQNSEGLMCVVFSPQKNAIAQNIPENTGGPRFSHATPI